MLAGVVNNFVLGFTELFTLCGDSWTGLTLVFGKGILIRFYHLIG